MSELVLHPLEKTLLKALQKLGEASLEQLRDETQLDQAAVSRAVMWLYEKGLATIEEHRTKTYSLGPEGRKFALEGFPERRLVEVLGRLEEASLSKLREEMGVSEEEFSIALGWARRLGWVSIEKRDGETFAKLLTVPEISPEERVVKALAERERAEHEIDPTLRDALEKLSKRPGVIEVSEKVFRKVAITEEGRRVPPQLLEVVEEVSRLTTDLIITGKWREVKLRRYDIQRPAPVVWPGKKQPYLKFLDELRERLVALGFEEMRGPIVEYMFFNCDALYMPQDHPAREIHDIYYIKEPSMGDLSPYSEFVDRVKAAHEYGWTTGSRGWGYKFSVAEAAKLILRSQGTALSARTLINPDLKIPGKYFSIVRCFRPDVVDRTHLTEFNQVEGIVVAKDLTLKELLGILKTFAVEIAGADKVRFRPDYFPFTEPSVELAAYKEGYGWLEFGGAGIFRPELTLPLGVEVPVIAWGLGVDRLFMMKAGIDDIRQLFTRDLDWLRKAEML